MCLPAKQILLHLMCLMLLIFQLITPEELINPAVDEKSVMTYLAQFPGAKYTPPLGRFRDVNHTPLVGVDSKFALSTRDSAVIPEITIVGPDGSEVDYDELRISETVYEYEYQPKIAGEHEVIVLAFGMKR